MLLVAVQVKRVKACSSNGDDVEVVPVADVQDLAWLEPELPAGG